ncbi:tyrosine-type recombinase/integrase [Thalassolituus sp.]|uniref:tyrosine-type recombinase/integrase n=1 Tax=Thalassolituus sp. TaxID=2030822 RepID=UPI003514DC84
MNFYLRYLDKRLFAVNTIKAQAYDLAYFLSYMTSREIELDDVKVHVLVDYLYHLRFPPDELGITSLNTRKRSENTIARMFSSVSSFYNHRHYDIGICLDIPMKALKSSPVQFLSHARATPTNSERTTISRVFRRSVSIPPPKTLTDQQIELIVKATSNRRDALLLTLLAETGLRIGQALQLRHEDIETSSKRLLVVRRRGNENLVYSKSRHDYHIDISDEWLNLYTEYLISDGENSDSHYVFTNMYSRNEKLLDAPYSYKAAADLFKRISNKTGIKVTPHMLRHSHATKLLSDGVPLEIVSKRLGHRNSITTSEIYSHIDHKAIRDAINRASVSNAEE